MVILLSLQACSQAAYTCCSSGCRPIPRQPFQSACCRHVHEQLTHAVHQAVDQYQGNECLLLVVEALQEAATSAVEQANQHAVEKSRSSEEKLMRTASPTQIGRRAIWCVPLCSCTPCAVLLCAYACCLLRISPNAPSVRTQT